MADTIAATRSTTSEVERQELAKRRKAFWLYFIRGPVWYGWTRERLEGFSQRFGGILGLNLLTNIADDYRNLIDEYHYCTSDSLSLNTIAFAFFDHLMTTSALDR